MPSGGTKKEKQQRRKKKRRRRTRVSTSVRNVDTQHREPKKGKNRKINRFEDEDELEIPKDILDKILTENKKLKEVREMKRKKEQGEKKQKQKEKEKQKEYEKRAINRINKPNQDEIDKFILFK